MMRRCTWYSHAYCSLKKIQLPFLVISRISLKSQRCHFYPHLCDPKITPTHTRFWRISTPEHQRSNTGTDHDRINVSTLWMISHRNLVHLFRFTVVTVSTQLQILVAFAMEARQSEPTLGTLHPSRQISLCGTFKVSPTWRVHSRICSNSIAISRAGTSRELRTWQICFETPNPSTQICLDGMWRMLWIWMEYWKVLRLLTCAIEDRYVGHG